MVDGLWFGHILNNALLHVLGAIANNHFMVIEDFLDHPFLVGGYSHLMPSYVFAVLFEKVAILRQLSEQRPNCGETMSTHLSRFFRQRRRARKLSFGDSPADLATKM